MRRKFWPLFLLLIPALSLAAFSVDGIDNPASVDGIDNPASVDGVESGGGSPPADVVLLPTADSVTYNAWTASTGTDKYAMVDDPVGSEDGDTTYIYTNSQNTSQRFTNLPTLPTGTILGVSVCAFYREEGGAWSGHFTIGVNGTSYHSSADPEDVTTTYAEFCYEWTTNPNTTAAWTETDVEGTGSNPLQNWGANSVRDGAGGYIRATAARLKVRYN